MQVIETVLIGLVLIPYTSYLIPHTSYRIPYTLYFAQVIETVLIGLVDLLEFAVLYFVVVLCFAVAGIGLFGDRIDGFASLGSALHEVRKYRSTEI